MAYDLLVNVYKIDKDRLYVTYYSTDKETDSETRDIWLKYLPKEKVLPFGNKENFWEMGNSGPCGPCTEIHYDFIGNRDASELVNKMHPTVIEIWNNVFIQYNRNENGTLTLLENKHVDTGMGLERITSILQSVDNNYDTDLFVPIINAIEKQSNMKYTKNMKSDKDIAFRVIADHRRASTISICDGAVPGYNNESSVLRSIIRRAIRYGKQFLNLQCGFFLI